MTDVTPMIHVPDVAATAAWYARLGFIVDDMVLDGEETVWARLRLGPSVVMLNCGGRAAAHDRRDVDLYVSVEDVQAQRVALPDGVAVIKDLHLAYHGMREFIVRDPNGFWITFGQWVGRESG